MQILTDDLLPAEIADYITVAICSVDSNHSEKILSAQETAEWNAFDNEKRRQEYVATRGLITKMVRHLGLDTEAFITQKDEYGKPFGTYKGKEFHISIAHTDHHVLCAVSPNLPVGIDLEPCNRNADDRLRKRILHDHEKTVLNDMPTIRIWTIKEALVKLEGRGMRTNLNECIVESKEEQLLTARFNNDKRAKICSFKYLNHWLAIAWNQ